MHYSKNVHAPGGMGSNVDPKAINGATVNIQRVENLVVGNNVTSPQTGMGATHAHAPVNGSNVDPS